MMNSVENLTHIHDVDSFAMYPHNCALVNLNDLASHMIIKKTNIVQKVFFKIRFWFEKIGLMIRGCWYELKYKLKNRKKGDDAWL